MLSRTLRITRRLPCLCRKANTSNVQQQSVHTTRQCLVQDFTFGDMKTGGKTDLQIPDLKRDEPMVHARPPLPMITQRKVQFPNPHVKTKQAWLENLDTVIPLKLGIVDLHPDIFATYPRLDVLYRNIYWQKQYKRISYEHARTRAELRASSRKLWSQKGTGRHRVADKKVPQWRKGGAAHGPRGPRSYFYMLPSAYRTLGLRVALSVKFAQADLHIVDSFELPSDEPEFIDDLVKTRSWGESVLFVDDTDIMPMEIALALNERPQYNLMPVYGLNVYSMLKHHTIVLTLAAVEKIEEKLLFQMHRQEIDRKYESPIKLMPRKVSAGPVRYTAKD